MLILRKLVPVPFAPACKLPATISEAPRQPGEALWFEPQSTATQYRTVQPSMRRSDRVGMTMYCPNCGLANPDSAKFCANCGTAFDGDSSQQSIPRQAQSQNAPPPAYQAPRSYQFPGASGRRRFVGKDLGIGCLILVLILLFFGVSCTRACFGMRRRVRMRRRY